MKLRCFVGFIIPETAKLPEIGERTVGRHWELAKVWLNDAITEENKKKCPVRGQIVRCATHA